MSALILRHVPIKVQRMPGPQGENPLVPDAPHLGHEIPSPLTVHHGSNLNRQRHLQIHVLMSMSRKLLREVRNPNDQHIIPPEVHLLRRVGTAGDIDERPRKDLGLQPLLDEKVADDLIRNGFVSRLEQGGRLHGSGTVPDLGRRVHPSIVL